MKDTTKIKGATYNDDISGLLLDTSKQYTLKEIYLYEAKNITKATLKYLSAKPENKTAPFSFEWFLDLHKEMFGDVWDWAGKLRQVELSIGVKAYLVSTELKNLVDDLKYWNENLLSKENPHRDDYIESLKKADNGDYSNLIKLQSNTI